MEEVEERNPGLCSRPWIGAESPKGEHFKQAKMLVYRITDTEWIFFCLSEGEAISNKLELKLLTMYNKA